MIPARENAVLGRNRPSGEHLVACAHFDSHATRRHLTTASRTPLMPVKIIAGRANQREPENDYVRKKA